MDGLIEGRIVHYVLAQDEEAVRPFRNVGEHRPAIIVKVWGPTGTCNLQVFTDSDEHKESNDGRPPVMWKTSVQHDPMGKPGTWHWIEKA